MANYDIIGSIAVLKQNKLTKKEKSKLVKQLLKRPSIKTVIEKIGKIKGRLRTFKTKFIAGERNLEVLHKENNCKFRLNVEICYFSPRLSGERKEIAGKVKKKDNVLVMFAGVGPYSVVIAKIAKPEKVVAIELSRKCSKYAKQNVKLNKLNNIKLIQGDVRKVVTKGGLIVKGNLVPLQFDKIVMPRPNLRESFLKQAFLVSKKGTIIYYYCFGHEDKLGKLVEEVHEESKKARKKIKILKIKKAGDIAPYKFRYRVDLRVEN